MSTTDLPPGSEPIRRRMMPPSMRRAVAIAIDLERTYDELASYVGHAMPLPDRIIASGGSASRRSRVTLPANLNTNVLTAMQQDRIAAIRTLHAEISTTLGPCETSFLDGIVTEVCDRADGEQRHLVARRGLSRLTDPDDRLSADDMLRRSIMRAADTPPPPAVREITPEEPPQSRDSFAVDLFVEGLLDHYKVDRVRLHAELTRIKPKRRNHGSVLLASPAERSNVARTIEALGPDFPAGLFRLRGLSLDTVRITMPIAPGENVYGDWVYQSSVAGRPRLERNDPMLGHRIHQYTNMGLTDVIRDARFHEALVIEFAARLNRLDHDGRPGTVLQLMPGYAHVDPPMGSAVRRTRIVRPASARRREDGWRDEQADLNHSATIVAALERNGQSQPFRIVPKPGGGLYLRIAEPGQIPLTHTYEIFADTIADGAEAISARIDQIVVKMDAWIAKHAVRPLPIGRPVGASPAKVPDSASAATGVGPEKTLRDAFIGQHGPGALEDFDRSTRLDVLLLDRLRHGAAFPDPDATFHVQEGILALRQVRLDARTVYRLGKYDRLMGRPTYAIAEIEVDGRLSPATIEALRDGSVSRLGDVVRAWPEFAQSQVRRVSVGEHSVVITVRVFLEAKPD